MRFIVSGGGTGGHIYPALAVARGLKQRYAGCEVLYVGTAGGMEADIVPREGIPFAPICASGLKRSLSLVNFFSCGRALWGMVQALNILHSFKPAAVVGTGGYASGPVVLAAAVCGVPTLIHEQNALPGITNRLLARFVDRVCVTFASSRAYFSSKVKIRVTGLPVRPEILTAERGRGLSSLGIEPGRFILLSFGGSRGARSINRAMARVIKDFAGNPGVFIVHATGKAGYEEFFGFLREEGIELDEIGNVKVMPYIYNMHDALAAADLAICRAGAATIAELTVLGVPAILVPYPHAAENHQEHNARALEREGAAQVILDHRLSGELLSKKIKKLVEDKIMLSKMAQSCRKLGKPRALSDILDCVEEIISAKM